MKKPSNNPILSQVTPDVKGLIFDMDGTLIDTMPLHLEAYNHALEPLGIVYSEKDFYQRAGIPTADNFKFIADSSGVELDPDKMTGIKRKYFLEHLEEVKIIELVMEVVEAYYGKLPLSIGTGSNRDSGMQVIRQAGLDRYFEHVVTASDVSKPKPDPETFLRCAKLMEVDPGDCMVFEDGPGGIQAALDAQMKVVDVRKYL